MHSDLVRNMDRYLKRCHIRHQRKGRRSMRHIDRTRPLGTWDRCRFILATDALRRVRSTRRFAKELDIGKVKP